MAKVRIVMTGHCRGEVWLDDRKVENVTAFSISAGVDEVSQLCLKLNCAEIELDLPEASVLAEKTTMSSQEREFERVSEWIGLKCS